MTDLRALLGDRYDEAIDKAGRGTLAADPFTNGAWDDLRDIDVQDYRDLAAGALAAVLPDLLDAARREGVLAGAAAGWDTAVRSMVYPDGTPAEIVANVNPYRTEGDPR